MLDQWIVSGLAAAGGGGAVALGLFRWLGSSWLENRFSQRLETYRREQAEELERTKAQVNLLLDRVTKIHEKEFEVLPQAWQHLQLAIGHVGALVSPFYEQPNLDAYSAEELEQFLASSRFLETERKTLRNASPKAPVYRELDFWHRPRDAKAASPTLHNYPLMNRIFLSADLADLFAGCDRHLTNSLSSLEIGHDANAPDLRQQATSEFYAKDPLVTQIEAAVQQRLRFHLANDAVLAQRP